MCRIDWNNQSMHGWYQPILFAETRGKCKEGECTLCWVGAFPSFPAQLCSGNATWKVVDSVKGRKGLVLCNLGSESTKDNARTNKFACSVCLLGQVTTLLWEAERALSWWVRMSGCTRDNKNMNLHQLLQATITQPPRLFISFAVHHDFEFQEYTEYTFYCGSRLWSCMPSKLMVGTWQGVVREGTYTVKELPGMVMRHGVMVTCGASTEYYNSMLYIT